uniref:Uncharacterized protein n=1 Tax=Kalanchoe fedtschenkoi TaxID=63787 RepID=A0A7N0TJ39_KALFE
MWLWLGYIELQFGKLQSPEHLENEILGKSDATYLHIVAAIFCFYLYILGC